MYSVVLATMMSVGGETPQLFWRCHGCRGCHCSCSCSGCYCTGYASCHGCYGSFCHGCQGCHGCHGIVVFQGPSCIGCHGCYGCHGSMGLAPARPAADRSLIPQNDAERDAVRKQLEQLRKKAGATDSSRDFAVVSVRMPVESRLFIDNTRSSLTSEVRTFRTPQLERGQQYFYVLRGEIERDGQIVSQSQRVLLSAGQQLNVQFDFNSNLQTVQR